MTVWYTTWNVLGTLTFHPKINVPVLFPRHNFFEIILKNNVISLVQFHLNSQSYCNIIRQSDFFVMPIKKASMVSWRLTHLQFATHLILLLTTKWNWADDFRKVEKNGDRLSYIKYLHGQKLSLARDWRKLVIHFCRDGSSITIWISCWVCLLGFDGGYPRMAS